VVVNNAGVLGGVGFVDGLAGDCWYLSEQRFPRVPWELVVDAFVPYVGCLAELFDGQ